MGLSESDAEQNLDVLSDRHSIVFYKLHTCNLEIFIVSSFTNAAIINNKSHTITS